jgi:hypothetical protein
MPQKASNAGKKVYFPQFGCLPLGLAGIVLPVTTPVNHIKKLLNSHD